MSVRGWDRIGGGGGLSTVYTLYEGCTKETRLRLADAICRRWSSACLYDTPVDQCDVYLGTHCSLFRRVCPSPNARERVSFEQRVLWFGQCYRLTMLNFNYFESELWLLLSVGMFNLLHLSE
jgi:hypothetical protein